MLLAGIFYESQLFKVDNSMNTESRSTLSPVRHLPKKSNILGAMALFIPFIHYTFIEKRDKPIRVDLFLIKRQKHIHWFSITSFSNGECLISQYKPVIIVDNHSLKISSNVCPVI